jgi:hypothetical protein
VLGTTLSFIVIMSLIAVVALDGMAAFARAGVAAAADHAVAGLVDDAVAAYQRALASAISTDRADLALESTSTFTGTPAPVALLTAATAPPAQLSASASPSPAATGAGPRFAIAYTIAPTTLAPPHCPGTTGAATTATHDVIAWLQCDGYVQESRMSLHVTVKVFDPTGNELLAQRDQYVSLRLFAEPPYSAVVGRTDGSVTAVLGASASAAAHEGDVGGDTVSGVSAPQPSPYPSGGTLIHVEYVCQPGTVDCSLAAPPDPDTHLQSNAGWTNGNVPQE